MSGWATRFRGYAGVGAGPMGESEALASPRQRQTVVGYWCANGHESRPSFAMEAEGAGTVWTRAFPTGGQAAQEARPGRGFHPGPRSFGG